MMRRVLITGGAGFIGSHLTDALLAAGCRVRILDALVPQVHGPNRERPAYLAPEAELIVGDVGDAVACRRALDGIEAAQFETRRWELTCPSCEGAVDPSQRPHDGAREADAALRDRGLVK